MNNGDKSIQFVTDEMNNQFVSGGLTKREYFAGLAMQGILVNYKEHCHYGNSEFQPMVSELAVKCADELLKQLEQPTNE